MTTQITEYSATEAALAELRLRYKDMTWDLTTTKGDKEARGARQELVRLRTSLEAKRKEVKAPFLAKCALIDTEAERIRDEIEALENPIDALIKADERRRADEKAERDRIERERVSAIQHRMAGIRSIPMEMVGKASAVIRAALDELSAMAVDAALFEEFELQAQGDRADAVKALTKMLDAVTAQEAEAARLQEAREALELEQAEQRRRDAEAQAKREAEEAERKARIAAEDEARRLQEEADRAARTEADRKAAEERAAAQKLLDDQAAELIRQREEFAAQQRAAEEAAKPVAVPEPIVDAPQPEPEPAPVFTLVEAPATTVRPTDDEILSAVAGAFFVSEAVAHEWLRAYASQQVAA